MDADPPSTPAPHAPTATETPLLSIRSLAVSFSSPDGTRRRAVDDASLSVYQRQMVALVGESGSGKTVTAMSVLGLLPRRETRYERGAIRYYRPETRGGPAELLNASPATLRCIRGSEIAMVFQEPMNSLNPVFTVGEQVTESVRLHRGLRGAAARAAGIAALDEARVPDSTRRFAQYPHELSGGLRQRVMIAMALAGQPRLLLADEPTTALDVTIQAEILALIHELKASRGLGVLFITHDLGIVAEHADVVCVMFAGSVVEYASVHVALDRPRHPYTRALLACAPRIDLRRERLMTIADWRAQHPDADVAPGQHAWWPDCGSPGSLIEVEPGHWVRTRDQQPQGSFPDLCYRRTTTTPGNPAVAMIR